MFFKTKILKSIALLVLGFCVFINNADAAGFQLGEQSVVGMGRAYSGGGVVGDDVSAIAYNPAGMSLGKGLQIQVSWTGVHINSKLHGVYTKPNGYTRTGSTELRDIVSVPSFFVTYQINDKFTAGLGVFPSYGFDIEYDADWFGNAHGIDSNLTALTINPSLSYKISDKWSIGVGFTIEKMNARLTSESYYDIPGYGTLDIGVFKMKADGWGYGYNFGVMFEPIKDTRIGLSYRSRVKHEIDGTGYKPTGTTMPVNTTLTLPDYALLSAYHKLNKWVGLSGSLRWTNWSLFEALNIESNDQTISYVHEKWKDTWYIGLGADFYVTDKFTLRAGWAYDSNPIKGAEYRTARIPDTYRYLLSMGASYKFTDHITVDAGYMHVFFDNANIDNVGVSHTDRETEVDRLTAIYKSSLDLFGVQLQVKF